MEPSPPTERFQHRAAAYADSRPRYPTALVDQLLQRLALPPGDRVADIGAGTGIFTRPLLERGFHVSAVEPNADMRRVAERELGSHPRFASFGGTAAATGLETASISAIFCAQAFHWFNEEPTLHEWRRILRPGGSAALIWNYQDEADPFIADYLRVVRAHGPTASATIAAAVNAHLDNVLFRHAPAEKIECSHVQTLDFEGLLSRSASTSYLPKREDPAFARLTAALRPIFERHQVDGRIAFAYRTVAVFGPLPSGPR